MTVERPTKKPLEERIYDYIMNGRVVKSIIRSGYPNTPRNQMLMVATNVFLHLHPTRINRTHVKITHTFCLGGLSFFMFLGLTEIDKSPLNSFIEIKSSGSSALKAFAIDPVSSSLFSKNRTKAREGGCNP